MKVSLPLVHELRDFARAIAGLEITLGPSRISLIVQTLGGMMLEEIEWVLRDRSRGTPWSASLRV